MISLVIEGKGLKPLTVLEFDCLPLVFQTCNTLVTMTIKRDIRHRPTSYYGASEALSSCGLRIEV